MPQFYEYPDPEHPTFKKEVYVFDESDAIDILLTKTPQSIIELREFAADDDEERIYGDAIKFKAFIDSEPLDWSDPEVMMAVKEIAERFYDNFHSEYKIHLDTESGDAISIVIDVLHRRVSYEVKSFDFSSVASLRDNMCAPFIQILSDDILEGLRKRSALFEFQNDVMALSNLDDFSILGAYHVNKKWNVTDVNLVLHDNCTDLQTSIAVDSDLYTQVIALTERSRKRMNRAISNICWIYARGDLVISPFNKVCYVKHEYFNGHYVIFKSEGIDLNVFADLCAREYPEPDFDFDRPFLYDFDLDYDTYTNDQVYANFADFAYADASGALYDPDREDPYYLHNVDFS